MYVFCVVFILLFLLLLNTGTSGDDARWNSHRWQKALTEFEETDSHASGYVARTVFVEVMRRQLKLSYDEGISLAKSIRHREGNGGECFVSYRALETLMTLPLWPHSMKGGNNHSSSSSSHRGKSRRSGDMMALRNRSKTSRRRTTTSRRSRRR